jgi:hypothetical protein
MNCAVGTLAIAQGETAFAANWKYLPPELLRGQQLLLFNLMTSLHTKCIAALLQQQQRRLRRCALLPASQLDAWLCDATVPSVSGCRSPTKPPVCGSCADAASSSYRGSCSD